jgi:hypothetical protein
MKPKIRVLLIAYNFPPFIRASSMRTMGWFKNFSDNIEITVVTRKWDKNTVYDVKNYFQEDEKGIEIEIVNDHKRIIRVPNRYNLYFKIKYNKLLGKFKFNKLLTFLELLLKWFPFVNLENERSLYYEARKELLKNQYDWVITSGEPFVLFKYALLLKKEFGVKISLDYRDGFSTNMFRNMSPNFLESLTIKLDRVFERKVIMRSDLVTFVSHKLKSEIENCVVHLNNLNTLIVNNGIDIFTFDENLNEEVQKIVDHSFFNLVFIGTLYEGHNLDMLLSAVEDLILQEKYRIKLIFVGSILSSPDFQKKRLIEFQNTYPEFISLLDYTENSLSRSIQRKADLLIKFNAFEQHEGHFGKKMYEYALSGKKVISINHKPTFKNNLNFFDDKPFIYYCNDRQEIYSKLKEFYNYWKDGYLLKNEINVDELKVFSTENQTKKFENELLKVKK